MEYHAGQLDERITIRRKTSTKDGFGGSATAWTDYTTLWALVRPMTGREREVAMRNDAVSDYLVVIRNRDDLLADDVIRWRDRDMNIRFPKDRGPRSAWLEIEASIGAPI